MKNILLFILISSSVIAETMEKQTLLQANAQHGGYVAPAFKLSRINDARFGMYGIRFGWIVNRTFCLGAAYYGMVGNLTHYDIYAPDEVQPEGNSTFFLFDTYHGGMEIEYIYKPDRQVHVSVGALMGIGHVRYHAKSSDVVLSDDRHLFIEPSINANVNISDHVKFILGFSYMVTAGVKAKGLDGNSLSGFTLNASVAFGIF